MNGANTYYGRVNEDGTFSVLARVTSLDGTGEEYSPGEGNAIKQADVSSITCKVYNLGTDKNNQSGSEITPSPSVDKTVNLFDTMRTVGWPTSKDPHGYNFRHDQGVSYVPSPSIWYLIEYKFTMTNGGIIWLKTKVYTSPIMTS